MDIRHSVYYGDQIVGTVMQSIKGLYYYFTASCSLSETGVYRLQAHSNTGMHDLGLLVPKGEHFTLTRNIPIKHLGTDELKFTIKDQEIDNKQLRIPLETNQPFPYLPQLEKAKLRQTQDNLHIILPQSAEDQSDSSREIGQ